MRSMLMVIALLGHGGDGVAQLGGSVDTCYGPPPSCGPLVFQRAIKVTTTVDVPTCPACPELPNEKDIFPEAIFIEAHRVQFGDGVTPDRLDLRAFAVFQRRFGGRGGFVSGEPCTYTIVSAITGQHALVLTNADPNKTAFRWVRVYIRPPLMPSTWCNFSGDDAVDLSDYKMFLDQWFTGSGGDDDGS